MESKIKLLFVDDDVEFLETMTHRLEKRDIFVSAYTNGADALSAENSTPFDVALLDLELPHMKGNELLIKLKEKDPLMEVVILTGHGSIESAAECTRNGAFSYLLKPCNFDELVTAISNAYCNRIKNKSAAKAVKVNEIMSKAIGMSPTELLETLRKIDKE